MVVFPILCLCSFVLIHLQFLPEIKINAFHPQRLLLPMTLSGVMASCLVAIGLMMAFPQIDGRLLQTCALITFIISSVHVAIIVKKEHRRRFHSELFRNDPCLRPYRPWRTRPSWHDHNEPPTLN